MTPATPSGARFWITVPGALYQQIAEYHLAMVFQPCFSLCHQTQMTKLNEEKCVCPPPEVILCENNN